MQDRTPLYPGRVKLIPVAGHENTYDMVRADEPTQEGDPLCKATLLKDATAARFGLDAAAVPNDVFAILLCAQIIVTAPIGSTVTLSKGDTVLTAQEISGTWTFNVPYYGEWILTRTIGERTNSRTVLVDMVAQYHVDMGLKLWLYKDGTEYTDITGGWKVTYFGSSTYSAVKVNDNNIYMKNSGNNDYQPYMATQKKIDTAGYTKLHLIANVYRNTTNSNSPGHFTMQFNSSNTRSSYYFGNRKDFSENVQLTNKEFIWDLSSENNYLLFGVTMATTQGYAEATVKQIWME